MKGDGQMKRAMLVLAALSLMLSGVGQAKAGPMLVADLKSDWSDINNPNTVTFGTWSYRQGASLLPEVSNFTFGGTVNFPTTQPAWAPSNNPGDFLPAEFKARSVPTNVTVGTADWQVGDVVVHTTDSFNGDSNGPANFLWTAPDAGTVTILGSVWRARVLSGRDNSWFLFVNGVEVSSGASIDTGGPDRTQPFLFSNGTGGTAALTQNVAAGSTIELEIAKTAASSAGDFVGVNFTITEATTAVPEPASLTLLGLGSLGLIGYGWRRRKRTPKLRRLTSGR
jgi:hypothetical protein